MTLKELVMSNKNDMQWQLFSRSGKMDLLKQLVKNQDCEDHVEDVTGEALELFMPMDVESWRILAGENSYRIEVRLKNVETDMYYVDVYEEDRMTVAGTMEFSNKEACKHFAILNQPCVVFTDVYTSTDCVYRQEIARYGMEDDE